METSRSTRTRREPRKWLRAPLLLAAACSLLLGSAPHGAHASDLYAKGLLGTAWGQGTPRGPFVTIGALNDALHVGSDTDSSSMYGAGIGLEVPLPEVFPWDLELPLWAMRFESELVGKANFDFRTQARRESDGQLLNEPFFHSVDATVTWLNNAWLDTPLYRPMAKLFRPFPVLKPVTFGVGFGVGISLVDVTTRGPGLSLGSDSSVNFAWLAGADFSYAVTDRVSLSLGYRYRNFGKTSVTMQGNGLDPNVPSTFQMSLDAHGFDAGVRVKFWSTDFPASLWSKLLR